MRVTVVVECEECSVSQSNRVVLAEESFEIQEDGEQVEVRVSMCPRCREMVVKDTLYVAEASYEDALKQTAGRLRGRRF